MRRSRALTAGALAALLLAACGSKSDDDTAAPPASTTTTTARAEAAAPASTTTTAAAPAAGTIEITIAGGNVEGGVRREKVKVGSTVRLLVTSDVTDEVHVHTYDLKLEVAPGPPAELTFDARIPGVFEVELEKRGKKVLELEVTA